MEDLDKLVADVSMMSRVSNAEASPQKRFSTMSTRKPKPLPTPPPSNALSLVDIEESLSRIEKEFTAKEIIKSQEKLISHLLKIMSIRKLPPPIPEASIPDKFENPADDHYKFAKQFPAYVALYTDLKQDEYTEYDRDVDITHGLAFLYNAKIMKPNSSETPENFYQRCQDKIKDSLITIENTICNEKDITIKDFFNSYPF